MTLASMYIITIMQQYFVLFSAAKNVNLIFQRYTVFNVILENSVLAASVKQVLYNTMHGTQCIKESLIQRNTYVFGWLQITFLYLQAHPHHQAVLSNTGKRSAYDELTLLPAEQLAECLSLFCVQKREVHRHWADCLPVFKSIASSCGQAFIDDIQQTCTCFSM